MSGRRIPLLHTPPYIPNSTYSAPNEAAVMNESTVFSPTCKWDDL